MNKISYPIGLRQCLFLTKGPVSTNAIGDIVIMGALGDKAGIACPIPRLGANAFIIDTAENAVFAAYLFQINTIRIDPRDSEPPILISYVASVVDYVVGIEWIRFGVHGALLVSDVLIIYMPRDNTRTFETICKANLD